MAPRRLSAILICCVAFACGIALIRRPPQFRALREAIRLQFQTEDPVPRLPSALVRSLRPNYPYSIVPGGAYSPAELRNAADRDGTVRAHYQGFDLANAKMSVAKADLRRFVSYRIGNRTYWTQKALRIPKGELLLTDGTNWARARCGNRLSESSPDQPKMAAPELLEKVLAAPTLTDADLLAGRADLAETPIDKPVPQTMPALLAAPFQATALPSLDGGPVAVFAGAVGINGIAGGIGGGFGGRLPPIRTLRSGALSGPQDNAPATNAGSPPPVDTIYIPNLPAELPVPEPDYSVMAMLALMAVAILVVGRTRPNVKASEIPPRP